MSMKDDKRETEYLINVCKQTRHDEGPRMWVNVPYSNDMFIAEVYLAASPPFIYTNL